MHIAPERTRAAERHDRLRIRRILPALLLFAAAPARAAELIAALAVAPLAADPHFYNGPADKALALHIFSRLVEQTPDTRLEPGLALSWRPLSDTEWEFRLRPGVTFQDGAALTPEDIVFSFARAPNVPNTPASFAPVLRLVTGVEIVDPHTIRIRTARPHPNLPNDLANVAIVARHVAEGATTADFNAGRAAVGSGPYRLVSFTAGERVVLARNPAWFGPAPAWERVTFRVIPNAGARSAALLSGDVDLIDVPSPSDLPRLRRDPRVTVSSVTSTRMWFLRLDRSRQAEVPYVTDSSGAPLPANPFNDLRVRQAMSIAINRQGLAERVMAGTVTPTGQWLAAGVYSYNPDIAVPQYDPERARALLAEAGYRDGFRLTLHGATHAEMLQAVAAMWTRIGIRTTVETMPLNA